MGDLKYCFEQEYVPKTLKNMKPKGLAVIDSDGIPATTVRTAVDRGVFVYDYLNVGALEKERSFYAPMQDLRLAPYEGWPGEYWIDPTADKWKKHVIAEARAKKAKGAIGLYLDNTDIYYTVRKIKKKYSRDIPSQAEVYKALCEIILTIVDDVGLIVMPNGGDVFVKRFITEHPGIIQTINQEGVFYEDFKKQPKSETTYRKNWMKWAQKRIKGKIRGIEYCKTPAQIAVCKAYYAAHGWDLYISKHTDLRGD